MSKKRLTPYMIRCVILFCPLFSMAQYHISGHVKDNTGIPIPAALVSVIYKSTESGIQFSRSDEKGMYRFWVPDSVDVKKLAVRVNAAGYLKVVKAISQKNETIDFTLNTDIHELPNVMVKSADQKLKISGDTLTYPVSVFSDKNDRVIGDILKKIPGIEIDENGSIKYQGKPINHFYIDGDDILGFKYQVATNNIPAGIVDKVQVIENNQHIKLLNGLVPSYSPGLNIVIKDKNKFTTINSGAIGLGSSEAMEGELNNLAFKPKLKFINLLKYNNTGNDLSIEAGATGLDMMNGTENAGVGKLLASPSGNIPGFRKQRYFNNHSASLNLNDFIKNKHDLSWKINAYFIPEKQDQNNSESVAYYLPDDTVSYQQIQRINSQRKSFTTTITANKNTLKKFFNNSLSIDWNITDDESDMVTKYSPVIQNINSKFSRFANNLNGIKLFANGKFAEYASFISYETKPQQLSVSPGLQKELLNNNQDYIATIQQTNIPVFFSNHYVSYKTNRGALFQSYKIGIVTQHADFTTSILTKQNNQQVQAVPDSFANHFYWKKVKFYAEAYYRFKKDRYSVTVNIPTGYYWIQYRDILFNKNAAIQKLLVTPDIRVEYKIGIENMARFNYQYGTMLSNANEIYRGVIMKDYQTFVSNDIPLQQVYRKNYNTGFDFRKSIKMLLVSVDYSYSEQLAYFIYASVFQKNIIRSTVVPLKNTMYNSAVSLSLSKYFFTLKTNGSIRYLYQSNRTSQLQNGFLFPVNYFSHNLTFSANLKPYSFISINMLSRKI